jgi:hypothetical protein
MSIEQQIPSAKLLECMDLVAQKYGHGNWSILCYRLDPAGCESKMSEVAEMYASLKVEEERKDHEQRIGYLIEDVARAQIRVEELEKENGESDIKILTLQSRIEELTKALEDFRFIYSEHIYFHDKERIAKLLNSK